MGGAVVTPQTPKEKDDDRLYPSPILGFVGGAAGTAGAFCAAWYLTRTLFHEPDAFLNFVAGCVIALALVSTSCSLYFLIKFRLSFNKHHSTKRKVAYSNRKQMREIKIVSYAVILACIGLVLGILGAFWVIA